MENIMWAAFFAITAIVVFVMVLLAFFLAGYHVAGNDAFDHGKIACDEIQRICKAAGKGE